MRNLYKFQIYPGQEPQIRKLAGSLPEDAEGFDAVHVFFRGSAVFLFTDGPGDPFTALNRDAKAKKFLDTLEEHTSFTRDDPEHGRLEYRLGHPSDDKATAGGEPATREVEAS